MVVFELRSVEEVGLTLNLDPSISNPLITFKPATTIDVIQISNYFTFISAIEIEASKASYAILCLRINFHNATLMIYLTVL